MCTTKDKLIAKFTTLLDSPMSIQKAIGVALVAHGDQEDRGQNAYILHVLRVMLGLETEDEMIPAVLHDTVEDTDITIQDLEALGLTKSQCKIVAALTKPKVGYDEEIYFKGIENSPVARRIKIQDMLDNSRLDRLKNKELSEKDVIRMNGYIRNLSRLGWKK
jgi:hypothetical protein